MIRLARFGDSYHDSVGYVENATEHLHSWCKSGFVRATLSGPGYELPIWEYAEAAGTPAQDLGQGLRRFTQEAAASVVATEIEALARREAKALQTVSWILMFVYPTKKIVNKTIAELRELVASDKNELHKPYGWYATSTLDWMILAEHGIAVEYTAHNKFKWCSPERALELAALPLKLAEYRDGLQAIAQLLAK